MAYGNNITTSLYGRRLGLQLMSTAQTGSANGAREFLVGPDGMRVGVSSAPTTSLAQKPDGISILIGTSVASTPVFTLDPPIPGVRKTIVFGSTDSALYIRTVNAEYIRGSSIGSSATTIRSSGGGAVELIGISTALWQVLGISSTAVNTVALQATT